MSDNLPALQIDSQLPADPALRRELKEAAPRILRKLIHIAEHGGSEQAVVSAGKLLLGLAGYVAPAAGKAPDSLDRQLAEFTPDDLKRLVDKFEGELAARATPINAPKPAEETLDGAQMLD